MRNTVAFANGKGGVGKTTLAANVAGLAAAGGWEVLAVDLDAQGNLAADLGYAGGAADDDGKALYEALAGNRTLTPSGSGVRDGLDVVAGGAGTRRAIEEILEGRGGHGRLLETLRPLASDYDLFVLDCPPADSTIVAEALRAADGLVVPVRPDAASQRGLALVARHYRKARRDNPQLRLLGVVLFGVSRTATRIRSEVRANLEEELDGVAPVFDAAIGYSERAAYDMRISGQLAHEYEQAADSAQRQRIRQLRDGSASDTNAVHYSSAAGSLAGDFEAVTDEILTHLVQGGATT